MSLEWDLDHDEPAQEHMVRVNLNTPDANVDVGEQQEHKEGGESREDLVEAAAAAAVDSLSREGEGAVNGDGGDGGEVRDAGEADSDDIEMDVGSGSELDLEWLGDRFWG